MSATLTPGLKVDGGVFTDLARVPELAGALERQGYDACWTGEINHDPFLPLLLAAEHTSRLELGTSIAVAFARNPMIVANVGWDLQTYSQGRFILGLGTQIKPHIEKRFSMPWSHPDQRRLTARSLNCTVGAMWPPSCISFHLQGEWDAMGTLIDDEILDAFAVVAPTDKLAAALQSRCDGVIDRVMPSFPRTVSEATVTAVVQELRQ